MKLVNSEIAEYRDEQVRIREDLIAQREELEKQFKLRQLIIENFIPQLEVDRLRNRSIYTDDKWTLSTIDSKRYIYCFVHTCVSNPVCSYPVISHPTCDEGIRPMSMLAKSLASDGDVRYMVCPVDSSTQQLYCTV